jgi:carbonic anhydrase/acetyltransferase-like protein (isoleucine patch superfamily)
MPHATWPGTTLLPFGDDVPHTSAAAFVGAGSRIIGAVTLGEEASIWYNCVLRGDVGRITVGARTNIQDSTTVHVTSGEGPTIIGADCLIGHLVLLHGCWLHDHSFVGMGAIVMDGCEIEPDAMLAAGAMLTPGKRIPRGQLWTGRPARYVRDLTPEEIEGHRAGVVHYVNNAHKHAALAWTYQG